ncbi:MAG: exodeoxyribonuclease VII large subunit, partial [Deltaproteobacteria bacterium]|nr:exodeoxyribonuclease VII large subunit [Deltaproteobacteria bacterium]
MEKIYTITEITNSIRQAIEADFPAVWVEGEASNVTHYGATGHVYFDLKDRNAKLPAVMFRNDAALLKFRIENGLNLHCFGRISIYPPQGKYQIILRTARPAGLGELLLIFEQLKEKLSREGLFDESLKRPIPFLPRRIGIVTSPEGAAIRDMLRIIHERFPAKVLLYPALVQGASAAKEIIAGINALNRVGDVDVIIIGRGGGSFEDLFAFCDEALVRAVRASRIPVISAVGHEIDYALTDFAADARAPTPTAAAGMVVPKMDDLRETLAQGFRTIVVSFERRLDDARQNMDEQRENLAGMFSESLE